MNRNSKQKLEDGIDWAFKLKVSPIEKLVLMYLVFQFSYDGMFYAPMCEIEHFTGLNKKTVIKAIKGLEAAGIIRVDRDPGKVNLIYLREHSEAK